MPNRTSGIEYTSYFLPDGSADDLVIQRCTFTEAFLRVPIQITNGTSVTLLRDIDPALLPQNNVLELIPSPTNTTATNSTITNIKL